MNKFAITGISALLLFSIFFSFNVFAENQVDKYLGKRTSCINIINILDTRVLDDGTILFETDMNKVYINRLPYQCPGLKMEGSFSYSTSLSRLCRQDIIKVLDEAGGISTSQCGLGEFVLLKGINNLRDAVKLLVDDGVLDKLVKERAFEPGFSSGEKR